MLFNLIIFLCHLLFYMSIYWRIFNLKFQIPWPRPASAGRQNSIVLYWLALL